MCETLTSQSVASNTRIRLLWLANPQTLPALNLLHLDYQLPSALFEYLSPMSMIIRRKHPHNFVSTKAKGTPQLCFNASEGFPHTGFENAYDNSS
ncbi:hypothetical protein J1N35_008916 [Gossypium stocksii]|uniref:Uncharacterized protein n=1 Tax=Gossypium stocksii TaxID=47602 RepID=A0A9D3WA73_9ROSI|nr:hypothetical protein J1N35_008916 [Gossypium stocksii]